MPSTTNIIYKTFSLIACSLFTIVRERESLANKNVTVIYSQNDCKQIQYYLCALSLSQYINSNYSYKTFSKILALNKEENNVVDF